jgi:hypothetical protein
MSFGRIRRAHAAVYLAHFLRGYPYQVSILKPDGMPIGLSTREKRQYIVETERRGFSGKVRLASSVYMIVEGAA